MAFQLDHSVGDALAQGALPVEYVNFLEGLQGNIIRSHGRDHSALLLLRLRHKAVGQARSWIAEACRRPNHGVHFTSAYAQMRQANKRGVALANHLALPQVPFCTLWLAHSGSERLGIAVPEHAPFRNGMDTRRPLLGDPPLDPAGPPYHKADAVLVLADDRKDVLDALVETARVGTSEWGELLAIEWGSVRRNAIGQRVEPFGHADSISDPDFMVARDNSQLWDSWAPLGLVLTAEPGLGRYGSFVVVRTLEQDVGGWSAAVAALTAQRTGGNDTLDEREQTAAMIFGRFRDGSPIVLNGQPSADGGKQNDFDYASDPFGRRCPFHAHIRKSNPRGGARFEAFDQERMHRIARRGVPYHDAATGREGIIFVCYQADIARQFEFIQRVWCNNPDFPLTGSGQDPVAGSGELPKCDARWPARWGERGARFAFSSFVRLLGGAYLYAPSLRTLGELA